MPKQSLSTAQSEQLRDELQRATLGALMASRRWQPGDIAFQGGTCLHLAHGSVRFSEDLDFMVRGGLSIDALAREVESRLDLAGRGLPGLVPKVTVGRADRNPRAFDVVLSSPDYIGSVRVKVELYETPSAVMDRLTLLVRPVQAPGGRNWPVPVLTADEILADKVYALGARDRLKPRDVYDLWWLRDAPRAAQLDAGKLAERLAIYPQGATGGSCETAIWWLERARTRLEPLLQPLTAHLVSADLRRWLPASEPMDADRAGGMLVQAHAALQEGIGQMQAHVEALCMANADRDGQSEEGQGAGRGEDRPRG